MTKEPRVKGAGRQRADMTCHWGLPLSQKQGSLLPTLCLLWGWHGPQMPPIQSWHHSRGWYSTSAPESGSGSPEIPGKEATASSSPECSARGADTVEAGGHLSHHWRTALQEGDRGAEALGTVASMATHRVSASSSLHVAPPTALQRPLVALHRDKAEDKTKTETVVPGVRVSKEGRSWAGPAEGRAGQAEAAQTGTGGGVGRSHPGVKGTREGRQPEEQEKVRKTGSRVRQHTPGSQHSGEPEPRPGNSAA